MKLREWELWACAHQVLKQHGDRAPEFVADRVCAMADASDWEGLRTWRAVSERLDQLRTLQPIQ